MDDKQQAIEELKQVLAAGVSVQTVAAITSYAVQAGKTDFLKDLNALLVKFQSALTEEEKNNLKKVVDNAISERSAELLLRMGAQLSEDDLTQALKTLKDIAEGK